MIAEESSAYPLVTRPIDMGGLGFGFKWNMGWMNDILAYVKLEPIYRRWHHEKLTFSLFYAFNENFILPFSHDEVVHGKKSMLDKQPGDLWQKFAGLRALYGYTMAHPGKKLLFMGGEFGHFAEWNYDGQLDWFLMVYERHPDLCRCVRALNHFYLKTPAFYQIEDSWDGFKWLTVDDSERSLVVFLRADRQGGSVICMTNFTTAFYPQFRFGLPGPGVVTEVFNTDLMEYGGSNQYNAEPLRAQEELCNGLSWSVQVCVPPMAAVYFRFEPDSKKKPARERTAKAAVGISSGSKES